MAVLPKHTKLGQRGQKQRETAKGPLIPSNVSVSHNYTAAGWDLFCWNIIRNVPLSWTDPSNTQLTPPTSLLSSLLPFVWTIHPDRRHSLRVSLGIWGERERERWRRGRGISSKGKWDREDKRERGERKEIERRGKIAWKRQRKQDREGRRAGGRERARETFWDHCPVSSLPSCSLSTDPELGGAWEQQQHVSKHTSGASHGITNCDCMPLPY